MTGSTLVGTILTFAGIVGVGWLLRATGVLRGEDSRALSAVVVYVGLPAFVFQAVHTAKVGPELLAVVPIAWVALAVTLVVALLSTRAMGLDRPRAGGFAIAAALGNTGYIGYPLTVALLGAASVPQAVFYDVFGTVFALVLVGLPVARRFGVAEETPRHLLLELLRFPAVIALAAALVLRPVTLPSALSEGLDLCASMVAPLVMLSVGLSLRARTIAGAGVALAALAGLKLVLSPLVALVVGRAVLGEPALAVAVLEAGMPSMMLTLAVGERCGLDTDFIASAIFVTTVLSAATIPLIVTLV